MFGMRLQHATLVNTGDRLRLLVTAGICGLVVALQLLTIHAQHLTHNPMMRMSMAGESGMSSQTVDAASRVEWATAAILLNEPVTPGSEMCQVPNMVTPRGEHVMDGAPNADTLVVDDGADATANQIPPRPSDMPRPDGPTRQAHLQRFRL